MAYLKRNAGSNSICEKRKGPDGKWRAVVLVNLGSAETPAEAVQRFREQIHEPHPLGMIYQGTRRNDALIRSWEDRRQRAAENLAAVLAYMHEQKLEIPAEAST